MQQNNGKAAEQGTWAEQLRNEHRSSQTVAERAAQQRNKSRTSKATTEQVRNEHRSEKSIKFPSPNKCERVCVGMCEAQCNNCEAEAFNGEPLSRPSR